MEVTEARHRELTGLRAQAYQDLFQVGASSFFPYHTFCVESPPRWFVDIFIYEVTYRAGADPVVIAVTNGLSDIRLSDADDPQRWSRCELIQYFRACTQPHARRLYDMAWLPLHDRFCLKQYDTIRWEHAAVPGTPWKNALFLQPLIRSHQQPLTEIESDPVTLLWHVPISDEELELKQTFGIDNVLDRMSEVRLPWIFDEHNRPSLVAQDR